MSEGITCYERDEALCTDQVCKFNGCRLRTECSGTSSIRQHIGWLKQFIQGMDESNWKDMRLRAERQLEELTADLRSGLAQGVAPMCTCPCSCDETPHDGKPCPLHDTVTDWEDVENHVEAQRQDANNVYAEALRLIRKHMQPGDTVGKMFLRLAKELEVTTEAGEVCDGCGKLLICRHCGKFRSASPTQGVSASDLQQVLSFLESIEGAGYGGMAEFEIARSTVKDLSQMAGTKQDAGLRDALATISIDDEGHRDTCLKLVLVAGYKAMKWALPVQAAEETIDAIMSVTTSRSPADDWCSVCSRIGPVDGCTLAACPYDDEIACRSPAECCTVEDIAAWLHDFDYGPDHEPIADCRAEYEALARQFLQKFDVRQK